MRFQSFRIRNFKGIKDTTISLKSVGSASVFALVGLNESGKTTVLEAIHSFAPDAATSELVGGEEGSGVPVKERVPRHLISNFTGSVVVTATLSVDNAEKLLIAEKALQTLNIIVDAESFPSEFVIEREQKFESGDLKINFFSIQSPLKLRDKNKRKWRGFSTTQEHASLRDVIFEFVPSIAYFPTFVFAFPERIFLTDRGDAIDRFYRRTFQDILDHDKRGLTVESDVVRRVRGTKSVVPWLAFWSAWTQGDDREKIQHVMDRAGAAVTRVVFGRWNEIFGEDVRGKEVVIAFDIVEGEKRDQTGARIKSDEHDVAIKFQIRDGTRRFDVNDRSLGFRWFFAFMLFTQFRTARSAGRPLLFLLDEPASNLHAAAQQKLIDSFPEIARSGNALAYTTHSHYMIEPKWLEQTFIVSNRDDAALDSIADAVSLDDESLNIQVTPYRDFANKHPNQTSYFQPILDRLNVIPSRFDIDRASVILEGKSDYYILRYALKALGRSDLPLLPGLGAGTFGALAALHVGWNLKFLFILDGDAKGKEERNRYIADFGIPEASIATLDSFVSTVRVIEDLLDQDARLVIQSELKLSAAPTKNQVRRFFQERLASDTVNGLSKGFRSSSEKLLDALKARL